MPTPFGAAPVGRHPHTVGRLPEAEAELRARSCLQTRRRTRRARHLLARSGNVLRDRGEAVDAERSYRESVALFGHDGPQTWRTEIYQPGC
jgi:hypothetical protein